MFHSDLGAKLRLAEENDVIFVEQGKTFEINLECLDEDGNVAVLGNITRLRTVKIWG